MDTIKEFNELKQIADNIINNNKCCNNDYNDNNIFDEFIKKLKKCLKCKKKKEINEKNKLEENEDDEDDKEEIKNFQPSKLQVDYFYKNIFNNKIFNNFEINNIDEIIELYNCLKVNKNNDDLIKRVRYINYLINKIDNNENIYIYILDGHGRTLLLLLMMITKNITNKIYIIIPEIDKITQLWHQYLFKFINMKNIIIETPRVDLFKIINKKYNINDLLINKYNENKNINNDNIQLKKLNSQNIIIYINFCSLINDCLNDLIKIMKKYKEKVLVSFSNSNNKSMNIFKLLFIKDNFIDYFKFYNNIDEFNSLNYRKIIYSKLINNFNNNYDILINYLPLTERKSFITLFYNNNCCRNFNFYYNLYYNKLDLFDECIKNKNNLLKDFYNELINNKVDLNKISIIEYINHIINFISKYTVKEFKNIIDKNNLKFKRSILYVFLLNNIYSSNCWKYLK